MRLIIINKNKIEIIEDNYQSGVLSNQIIPISLIWLLTLTMWIVFIKVDPAVNMGLFGFSLIAGLILTFMLIYELMYLIHSLSESDRKIVLDFNFREISDGDKIIKFENISIRYFPEHVYAGIRGFFFRGGDIAKVQIQGRTDINFAMKMSNFIDLYSYLQKEFDYEIKKEVYFDRINVQTIFRWLIRGVILFLGVFLIFFFRQATIPNSKPHAVIGAESDYNILSDQ